ncbi:hypothetical protein D3C83_253180 [compost metagenome]
MDEKEDREVGFVFREVEIEFVFVVVFRFAFGIGNVFFDFDIIGFDHRGKLN